MRRPSRSSRSGVRAGALANCRAIHARLAVSSASFKSMSPRVSAGLGSGASRPDSPADTP